MVTEELYIIAIELGSSKMTGIGGKRLADGSFEIKGLAVENSSAFMRNGAIFPVGAYGDTSVYRQWRPRAPFHYQDRFPSF